MRKLFSVIIALTMMLSLAACGKKTDTTPPDSAASAVIDLPIPEDYEKPFTDNAAILYNKQSSSYDAQAEARRQSILNTPDSGLTPTDGGSTYYISYRGSDANDGLSPQTPWKTVTNLNNGTTVSNGSVILFERAGIYRNVSIRLNQGVSVGAYGEGPKPQLFAGDKSYADESLWTQTSTPNVWSTTVSNVAPLHGESSSLKPSSADIGNIIFDHGAKTASENKQLSLDKLEKEYDFYFEPSNSTVYLYLSENPASRHSSIEMAPNKHIIRVATNDHVIENVCLKYTGAHGISSSGPKNLIVRGCEIGYIGGARLNNGVRYGNGIEFFGSNSGCVAENNWIYQCFDAGYSNQGSGLHEGIKVQGNLIEYCVYNIEVWVDQKDASKCLSNCSYTDNICRFAGYGFGSYQRMNSSAEAANVFMYSYVVFSKNTMFSNNVFDCSSHMLVSVAYPNDSQGRGPSFSSNTWIQKKTPSTVLVGRPYNTPGSCASQSAMEAGVKGFESNPVSVTLED